MVIYKTCNFLYHGCHTSLTDPSYSETVAVSFDHIEAINGFLHCRLNSTFMVVVGREFFELKHVKTLGSSKNSTEKIRQQMLHIILLQCYDALSNCLNITFHED